MRQHFLSRVRSFAKIRHFPGFAKSGHLLLRFKGVFWDGLFWHVVRWVAFEKDFSEQISAENDQMFLFLGRKACGSDPDGPF